MLQWFCKSDWLDLLQPNCPWQTANLAFIEHISIHHYFYYVHLFLENSSIFSHFFSQKFLVLLGQSLIQKKLHSLKTSAESFWVILGLILVVFSGEGRFSTFFSISWETFLYFQGYVRSHFCTLYRSPYHGKPQIFPLCFAQIFWSLRKKE